MIAHQGWTPQSQSRCGHLCPSRLFLLHFSKHLSSVSGRTELCHEVRNPGPKKKPKSSAKKATIWHCSEEHDGGHSNVESQSPSARLRQDLSPDANSKHHCFASRFTDLSESTHPHSLCIVPPFMDTAERSYRFLGSVFGCEPMCGLDCRWRRS